VPLFTPYQRRTISSRRRLVGKSRSARFLSVVNIIRRIQKEKEEKKNEGGLGVIAVLWELLFEGREEQGKERRNSCRVQFLRARLFRNTTDESLFFVLLKNGLIYTDWKKKVAVLTLEKSNCIGKSHQQC
jgi:hypothetical protein